MRTILRLVAALAVIVVALIASYAVNVMLGMRAQAQTTGTIAGLPLQAPVTIARDGRGIPHIRAENEHDLFFADGFVQGQDRAFQLDLLRRYVYGQLAEVLGSSLVATDEHEREVPVAQIVSAQMRTLDMRERNALQAFADGVNAAFSRDSTPVEFRALMYRPRPWQAQDSLAVGFATVLDLTDTWNDVAARVGRPSLLTDPCYDAPVTEGLAKVAQPRNCPLQRIALLRELLAPHPAKGSNAWASGAAHTTTGRALLASDPHLRLQIPGIWYLVDLHAPEFHAAGATLAGTPGVILGHNDHLAWGATNGTVAALSVFDAPKDLDNRYWQNETFHVRFGGARTRRYYRAPDVFGVNVGSGSTKRFVLVRWSAYSHPQSPVTTFDRLDRAATMVQALAALRAYPDPTQNFVLADDRGRVAYQLAGTIPDDPLWGEGIHPARDLAQHYRAIPFAQLPHITPSRDAIVWTANNKMYGDAYRYRLSAAFAPPYRAYRIARMLQARKRYDVAYFSAMQMDTLSVAEHEFSRYFPALAAWDGRFRPSSKRATAVYDGREELAQQYDGDFASGLIASRTRRGTIASIALPASPAPWGVAGSVVVKHPLAALGMSFLNGTTFRGDGDAFTVHRQNYGFSQSYRAVWDVGNWDIGGIIIPQGESGRPGSGHYTDEAADWSAGRLLPLPYSDRAVERATVERLTLTP